MLNTPPHAFEAHVKRGVAPQEPAQFASIDVAGILAFLRRRRFIIGSGIFLGLFFGALYLALATPRYTASAFLLIDTRKNQFLQSQRYAPEMPIDPAAVESQVEILRSENLTKPVIRDLQLTKDEEFVGSSGGVLSSVLGFFGKSDAEEPSDTDLLRKTTRVLLDNLQVKRIGLSYVIEVSYRSKSAEKSASVANAVAEAYLVDQLEAKYQSTRRANVWLQARIQELREQASQSDRSVQDFKAKNNIVETGRGLMNEQQLSEINSQLILMRAQTAEAKARMERIDDIVKASSEDLPDGNVTDALKNDVITRLRQQFLDASRREAEWSARYGPLHVAALNLRNEMRQIKKSIQDEITRIAATYRSDYEISRVREDALQKSLNDVIQQSAETNQDRVVLRDLESASQTSRALYDNFLQRYMETVQQESFPVTEARIITNASQPLQKSHPKTTLIGAASLAFGLLAGLAVAFFKEHMDRVFRSDQNVKDVIGVTTFGYLPLLTKEAKTAKRILALPSETGARLLSRNLGLMRLVAEAPFSEFTETVRAIKLEADIRKTSEPLKVIGVISSLPGEGKTTIASNLAQLVAQNGQKVILLDLDLRNPSLSRQLVEKPLVTVLDVLAGRALVQDAIWKDPITGLDFMPTHISDRLPHSAEILGSNPLKTLIRDLSQVYDYVIVDLPPLAPIVDTRATASFVDGYVLVIEWGESRQEMVRDSLDAAPAVYDKLLGAVLNKTRLQHLARFDDAKGHYRRVYTKGYGYRD